MKMMVCILCQKVRYSITNIQPASASIKTTISIDSPVGNYKVSHRDFMVRLFAGTKPVSLHLNGTIVEAPGWSYDKDGKQESTVPGR